MRQRPANVQQRQAATTGESVQRTSIEKRIARLNRLCRDLDERAASMHLSAWPEALKEDMERWKRLAKKL